MILKVSHHNVHHDAKIEIVGSLSDKPKKTNNEGDILSDLKPDKYTKNYASLELLATVGLTLIL